MQCLHVTVHVTLPVCVGVCVRGLTVGREGKRGQIAVPGLVFLYIGISRVNKTPASAAAESGI